MEFTQSLLYYYRVVAAHRVFLLLLCLSALIVSTLLTYVLPEEYETSALLMVKPREEIGFFQNRDTKEVLDFPANAGVPYDVPSKTYMEVIKSRAMAERIVRALDLDQKPELSSKGALRDLLIGFRETCKEWAKGLVRLLKYGSLEEASPFEEAVEDLQEDLSLTATKNTVVFEITYTAEDAQEAADVANTAAEMFIRYVTESDWDQSDRSCASIEVQMTERQTELEEARSALKAFKESHAAIDLSEEYPAKLKVLSALETELELTQAELAGLVQTYTRSHPKVMSLLAERDRLLQSLAQLKAEFGVIPATEKELETLKMRVRIEEDNYESVRQEYEEARLQQAHEISEIRIVSRAIPPTYPAKPIRIFWAGASLIFSFLVGLGLILFLELTNARIRSTEDVARILQVRVLATIPPVKSPKMT